MKNLFYFMLLVAFSMISQSGFGQEKADTTRIYRIEMTDGNIFTGRIISEDEMNVVFNTDKLGVLTIQKMDIKSKTALLKVTRVKGEYWLPNPQSSRYFWAPNGYGLKKNEIWYQNIWVLYNQVSFGLTDNFSFGVGTVPVVLFAEPMLPVWLVPKFSIPVVKNKFNIGTGAFLATVIGEESSIFGLLYGTATIGSRDKNMSFGMGYGFFGKEWAKTPVFNLSFMNRTGPRGYLISENYVISEEGEVAALISMGGRSIIRNIGLDYSLWIPIFPDMQKFYAFPFLGITVPIKAKSNKE